MLDDILRELKHLQETDAPIGAGTRRDDIVLYMQSEVRAGLATETPTDDQRRLIKVFADVQLGRAGR